MTGVEAKQSHTGSELDVVSFRLEGIHEDIEAGPDTMEETPNSSAASTVCATSAGLSVIPTHKEDTTLSSSGNVTSSTDSAAEEERDAMRKRGRGLGLIQIKTETRKKWSTNPKKGIKTTTKYFYEEIDSSWTVALVVVCFFVAGMVDAVSYQCWSTFVSMQTGNTILVALRLSDMQSNKRPLAYLKCLVSIGSYCLGSLLFNILHRFQSGVSNLKAPLHRWTLFLAFGVQTLLLAVTAVLATTKVVSTEPNAAGTMGNGLGNYLDLLPIGLLAFEASGQVCVSRVLIISDLPTIVISTLYHDFMSEALCTRRCWRESKTMWDFAVTQKKQIRRLSGIIALFSGSLIGGFMYSTTGSIMSTLWLATGAKMCICLAWILWKKKVVVETVVTTRGPDGGLQQVVTRTQRR